MTQEEIVKLWDEKVEEGKQIEHDVMQTLKECDMILYEKMKDKTSSLWLLLIMFQISELGDGKKPIKQTVKKFVEKFNDGSLLYDIVNIKRKGDK